MAIAATIATWVVAAVAVAAAGMAEPRMMRTLAVATMASTGAAKAKAKVAAKARARAAERAWAAAEVAGAVGLRAAPCSTRRQRLHQTAQRILRMGSRHRR